MGVRGKKSAAALQIVTPENVVKLSRAAPPDDLDEEQAAVWRTIVNRLPADWFQAETYPLLAAYCRHIVQARRVADLIRQMEEYEADRAKKKRRKDADDDDDDGFSIKDYDRLLKMQERESRAIASLAVKMRLSQSTAYDKSKKKGAGSGAKKPWEG